MDKILFRIIGILCACMFGLFGFQMTHDAIRTADIMSIVFGVFTIAICFVVIAFVISE